MTLTAQFNSKAKTDSREDADSERFGGKSLSRYFCAVAMSQKQRAKEIELKIVEVQPAPAIIIRRGQLRPGA